ncbi:MAG: hypothetical protein KKH61_20760 [Gammaproteobacteria bacterium]|nr:hypothetical protein [Gammaproteobacteria bacterium]
MALVTGTPPGTTTSSEDIYLESAPSIYIQDYNADLWFNPDSDGFYWGLTGTVTYPIKELGCPVDVSLTENLTINDVRCDNVGVKDTVQQRQSVDFVFTIQSFFPLQILTAILNGSAVTETSPTQKFGLGKINNNQYWHLHAPKVYDEDAGYYVVISLNKTKFVDAWTINMPYGSQWQVTGLKMRAFADTTKPAAQQFGMIMRADAGAIT